MSRDIARKFTIMGVGAAVLALAFAAAPSGAAPKTPKPPKPNPQGGDFTIVANPNPVTFGRTTGISGKLKGGGGVAVQLFEDPFPFDTFNPVATAATANNGDYGFQRAPTINTRYRVVQQSAPATTTPDLVEGVALSVKMRVSDRTPKKCQRVRFSGTAKPEHSGALVRIQRATKGGYSTVKKTRTVGTAYKRSFRVCADGTYRASVESGDGNHVTGASSARSINVHG